MGILDSVFGSQDQGQQGPQSPGILGRMQAQYAPGAYAAKEQAMQQQAIYNAAMQLNQANPGSMSPQVAQAMAMSPQFFAAQQQSYLPQASQVQMVQNADGSQTPVDIRNQGGGAGHGHALSGLPITEAPGTTAAPAGAAGATAPQGQSGNAPAGSAKPRSTLQGMPGSNTEVKSRIDQALQTGQDPMEALKGTPYENTVKAVMDGRMTLSEIKQTRNEHIAGTVRDILLKIDPNFNEIKNEKTNSYVKSYMDTKSGDVGMSRNSLGTSLNHINSSISNQLGLNNHDANMSMLGRGDNLIRNQFGEQASKAGAQNALSGTAADELARFITGKPPSDAARKEYADKFPNASDTPRVAAGKYEAMADLLEGRLKDMEAERDQNFSGKNVAKDYPIALPEHQKAIADIRQKAAELRRRGEYQIQHGQGAEAPPAAAGGGLPAGWKYVK